MSEANTEVNQNAEEANYLNMSDEDILKSMDPTAVKAEEKPAPDAEEAAEDAASGAEGGNAPEDGATDDDEEPAAKPGDEESDEAADKDTEKKDSATDDDKSKEPEDKKPEDGDEKKPDQEDTINYKSEYERLLAPFKANGREIAVKSVDDAISLMQMGANYNKKMAALKPNLKLMKLLENNGLLSEEKISFLIDLENKDPGAINKLVKDSGMDPMDLDAEKASGYKQSTYTVDDREIELDTVLDELRDSSSYTRTLEIVSTKWDPASKQVVAGQPQIMKIINDHIESGIYDLIEAEVENERLFGRLTGLSDIEAYRRVGDALHAKGAFNQLSKGKTDSPAQGQQQPAVQVVQPKPKSVDEDKLKDKKRAASSTKAAVPSSSGQDFNPLSLSDEEFSKLVNKQFL